MMLVVLRKFLKKIFPCTGLALGRSSLADRKDSWPNAKLLQLVGINSSGNGLKSVLIHPDVTEPISLALA